MHCRPHASQKVQRRRFIYVALAQHLQGSQSKKAQTRTKKIKNIIKTSLCNCRLLVHVPLTPSVLRSQPEEAHLRTIRGEVLRVAQVAIPATGSYWRLALC